MASSSSPWQSSGTAERAVADNGEGLLMAAPFTEDDEDDVNYFQGGSLTCTTELNLFYLCFGVLGEEMKTLTTIISIVDLTIERALQVFLQDRSKTRLLLQLSSFPQVQERMYEKIRDVLRGLIGEASSTILRETLMEIIRNLSRCASNKLAIYQDFVGTLFHDLTCGASLRIIRFALGALNNLATLEENAVALLRMQGFVDTILKLTLDGGTPTIRERALWTLQSLACADENEIPMFEAPGLVDTLIVCLEIGDTNEIRSYAIETLRNLANQNGKKMIQNRRLMNALLDVTTDSGCHLTVKELAYSCFARIGFNRAQVQGIQKLQVLCYARDTPRLCRPQCRFSEVPNELIRKMGEALYGKAKCLDDTGSDLQ